MSGFLSGLGELLGGFNAQRRIDKEGFDWREKQQAAEFERQRERELAGQQNQQFETSQNEALSKQLADVAEGTPEGTDLESMIPAQVDQARRKFIASRAKGLQVQNKRQMALLTGGQRMGELDKRLQAQMAALQNTREFQAAQQEERLEAAQQGREYSADRAMERTLAMLQGRGGGQGVGRWKPIERMNLETGEVVVVDPATAAQHPELYGSPPTAAQKDRAEASTAIVPAMDAAKEAAKRYLATGGASKMGALIPGVAPFTDAGVAWEDYRGQLKLAASRLGRSIEGARMSDQDRAAYTEALATLNQAAAMAQPDAAIFARLERAKKLAEQVVTNIESQRKRNYRYSSSQTPQAPAATPSAGRMVKYKGQLVPLSSLPPQLQALVR